MECYLQQVAGHDLTGDTGERCLFVLHGNGANALLDMLGDYGQAIPPETLMVRRSGGIPNDVARL